MVEAEYRGNGDMDGAVRRISQKTGLDYWPIEHLRRGKAKTVEAGLFQRIRCAYLSYCERKVSEFQQEIAIEKAKAFAHDDTRDLAVLECEMQVLAEKIAARKAHAAPED